MMVVSWELFQQLTHPERKPRKKLKPDHLVARDSFTGETMDLVAPEEFFKKKPRRKPGKRKGPASAKDFFDCTEEDKLPEVETKGRLIPAKEFFKILEKKEKATKTKRRGNAKKGKTK